MATDVASAERERRPDKASTVAGDAAKSQPSTTRAPAANHFRLPGNQALLPLQRKCTCGGTSCECEQKKGFRIQTKVRVGPANDPSEQEADQVAETVMRMPMNEPATATAADVRVQRTCAACEQEENGQRIIRRHPIGREGGDAEGFSHGGLTQGGSALQPGVRGFFESRFGRDFSSVRVHTGSESDALNAGLNSHAFTYGSHIWLANGHAAQPSSLMAHELAHVVQQSGPPTIGGQSDREGAMRPSSGRPLASGSAIQRKNDYFSLPNEFRGKGAGTRTHDMLFPEIAKENPGLFFEVKIPGGKKDVTAAFKSDEPAVVGRADFYKASTTIGVKFVGDDPEPEYLESHRDLRLGVPTSDPQKAELNKFAHASQAAPVGKKNMIKAAEKASTTECSKLERPALCRMDEAPGTIELADLKPSDEGERHLGDRQLDNYITGIKQTASKVNDFARDNPTKVDPAGRTWNPSPTKMAGSEIKIPEQYKPFNSNKRRQGVIRYENGKPEYKAKAEPADVYVVPDPDPKHEGLLIYEYVPVSRATDVTLLERAQEKASQSLKDPVIKELNEKLEVKAKRKPGPPPRLLADQFRIQRKTVDDQFKFDQWKPKFKNWQDTDAKTYLGSAEHKKTEFLDTLLEIKKRSLKNLVVATGAEKLAATMHKIEHWNAHGGTYGRLRGIFGGVYVKFINFYEKARDKFRGLLPKRQGSSSDFLGTLIKVGMKILRFVAHFIMGEVAERLTQAFKQAAENVIQALFGDVVGELEEQIAEVRAYINDFEELVGKNIEAVIDNIIKPYREHIDTIQKVMEGVSDITKWVNRIKWLARAAACVAVPGIGCIMGLIGTKLLETIASEIAEQCWFRREIMFPILRKIKFVASLPGTVVDFVLKFLTDVLPGKAKELVGNVKREEAPLKDEDACQDLDDETPVAEPSHITKDWKPTPVDYAVMRLYEKYGDVPGNPIGAVGELLRKYGLSNMPYTVQGVERVEKFLDRVNGDAGLIRRYNNTIQKGQGPVGPESTLDDVLSAAESGIAGGLKGPRGGKIDIPEREHDPRGKEGMITIWQW